MRVLVAMSGGVDSSVAAALLCDEGHEVVGATMKLWGGVSDTGCCSVSDVNDARRVADHLGIDHHVFNFTTEFDDHVVGPYVEAHRRGETPNPCVECNRHLKFDVFLTRALRLGFDAIATGHHAQITRDRFDQPQLRRGADRAKDQSYVLSILGSEQLCRLLLPVGTMQKSDVRAVAAERGLLTATKPDSQDVCFIPSGKVGAGRATFLGARIPLHRGRVVDRSGERDYGEVDAVELVTVGQRRGLPTDSSPTPRFVIDVDVAERVVTVGERADLLVTRLEADGWTWTNGVALFGAEVAVQSSAHGAERRAVLDADGVTFFEPSRRIAAGQILAFYQDGAVVGSAVVRS